MNSIHLGPVKIPIDMFASQGNAILGIRGSGKTYTATYLAEQLLKAGIPFVAFDPIGVWRFLKVPGKGQGFKVVVAGDKGDLPLTPQTAPEIVRAAMRENIPLVLDLYSMHLSKADWKSIVESAIRLLLYENKDCGLRHVFIEEAAEFCPQRVGPDQGRVYAEIEKLARMGGNASLGYTLINQRAEEVNKAVLELCDCLFLHRQKGRNSLAAVEKWLSWANEATAKDVTKTLPTLAPGHCWIWTEGSEEAKLAKVPEKESFHPDRKNPGTAQAKAATDVGKFVDQLKGALGKSVEKLNAEDPAFLRKRIRELEHAAAAGTKEKEKEKVIEKPVPMLSEDEIRLIKNTVSEMEMVVKEFQVMLSRHVEDAIEPINRALKQRETTKQVFSPPPPQFKRLNSPAAADSNGFLPGGARRMLIALAQRLHVAGSNPNVPLGLTKQQLGVRAGLAHSSGTFGTYLGRLRSLGYVETGSGLLVITNSGLAALGHWEPLPRGRGLFEHWLRELPGGAARMLTSLFTKYPASMTAEELGRESEISHTSGTFGTYLGRLRSLDLVQGSKDKLRATDEFLEG
jgi:hypothetical protein